MAKNESLQHPEQERISGIWTFSLTLSAQAMSKQMSLRSILFPGAVVALVVKDKDLEDQGLTQSKTLRLIFSLHRFLSYSTTIYEFSTLISLLKNSLPLVNWKFYMKYFI